MQRKKNSTEREKNNQSKEVDLKQLNLGEIEAINFINSQKYKKLRK